MVGVVWVFGGSLNSMTTAKKYFDQFSGRRSTQKLAEIYNTPGLVFPVNATQRKGRTQDSRFPWFSFLFLKSSLQSCSFSGHTES